MKIRCWATVCALLLAPNAGRAQVDIASAPEEISLLNMFVRKWSAASPLGDLRTNALGDDDLEVRAWGGFGLAGTFAVVARRNAGIWRAWRIIRHECSLWIPIVHGDSLTEAAIARYQVQARAQCGTPPPRLAAARIISVDTLAITPLAVDATEIDGAWNKAVEAGLLSLPGRPAKKRIILDGFTYVIELRVGRMYRASEFPKLSSAEDDADAKVQRVFAILANLLSRESRRP